MKSNYIIILFIIFITGLVIWGIMLRLTYCIENGSNELLIDMGKTGASLSLISAGGWLLQVLLRNRELKRQREKEKLSFYRNVLSDLKSVYDKVEKARLLINAHQTAKTYGEQMRELIGGVVTLHNIKRALNPEFPKLEKELIPCIDAMSGFIKELLKEYANSYKLISILQEIDEKEKEELKKTILEEKDEIKREKLKKSINEQLPTITDTDTDTAPITAWEKIKALPKLAILRDEDKHQDYKEKFLNHLDKASVIVRKKIPVENE